MRLIKPSFEILESQGYLEDIEIAGRTCYKSNPQYEYFDLTDRPNEPIEKYVNCEINISKEEAFDRGLVIRRSTTAKEFVERMIKSKHYAMLEHGTIYLTHPIENIGSPSYLGIGTKYRENKYSKVNYDTWGTRYITTNYRVLVENDWLDDLKYICEPTEFHEKRTSVRFICDIGITREFNRHRVNSMAEQSTRYCNYTKDKFGSELTIIQPEEILDIEVIACKDDWHSKELNANKEDDNIFRNMCTNISLEDNSSFNIIDTWLFANLACQWSYNRLIQLGWKPQQARRVLPLDLQTELVHTAFDSDWKHFFDLRDDSHAHPQAFELAHPLHEEFIKLGIIK